MRYGLPYKGSKNSIAEWIVSELPKAECFVDLFCGGCAVTHAALVSGKYDRFIINDIDGRIPELFLECCYGKHTLENHKEWISREEFFKRKDADAYIALVWSFGNNGVDYLYARDLESLKKGLHYAVFNGDLSLLDDQDVFVKDTDETNYYKRYLWFKRQLEALKKEPRLEVLERAIEIERLQSLQSLQSDYAEVDIPDGALIYCDIPYKGSNCGKYKGFDHERFYVWAEQQDNIYISEYDMPDCFIPYARIEKNVLSAANGNSAKSTELIYTNQRTYDRLQDQTKEQIRMNFAEQVTIFDLI